MSVILNLNDVWSLGIITSVLNFRRESFDTERLFVYTGEQMSDCWFKEQSYG